LPIKKLSITLYSVTYINSPVCLTKYASNHLLWTSLT